MDSSKKTPSTGISDESARKGQSSVEQGRSSGAVEGERGDIDQALKKSSGGESGRK